MLCDSCDRAFHSYCVGLGAEVPDGDWYCPDCNLGSHLSSLASLQGPQSIHGPSQRSTARSNARARTRPLSNPIHITLASAPQPPHHRVSQGAAIPVSRRTPRTGVHLRTAVSAAMQTQIRGRRRLREVPVLDNDSSDSDRETLAERRHGMLQTTACTHVHAMMREANSVLEITRRNREGNRGGATPAVNVVSVESAQHGQPAVVALAGHAAAVNAFRSSEGTSGSGLPQVQPGEGAREVRVQGVTAVQCRGAPTTPPLPGHPHVARTGSCSQLPSTNTQRQGHAVPVPPLVDTGSLGEAAPCADALAIGYTILSCEGCSLARPSSMPRSSAPAHNCSSAGRLQDGWEGARQRSGRAKVPVRLRDGVAGTGYAKQPCQVVTADNASADRHEPGARRDTAASATAVGERVAATDHAQRGKSASCQLTRHSRDACACACANSAAASDTLVPGCELQNLPTWPGAVTPSRAGCSPDQNPLKRGPPFHHSILVRIALPRSRYAVFGACIPSPRLFNVCKVIPAWPSCSSCSHRLASRHSQVLLGMLSTARVAHLVHPLNCGCLLNLLVSAGGCGREASTHTRRKWHKQLCLPRPRGLPLLGSRLPISPCWQPDSPRRISARKAATRTQLHSCRCT
jgi:hypothetical protein